MRGIRFAKCYTHLDVGDEEIETAIEAATRIIATTVER
jgi:hypothetical protein